MDYYPWNVENLSIWVKQQLDQYENINSLSEHLNIDAKNLRAWLQSNKFDITVPITREQIVAISQYRHCSVDQVISWLEIKPLHWQSLLHASEHK